LKEPTLTEHVSDPFQEMLTGIDPSVAEQQLNDKVGMTLVEMAPERVVATMPVEGNLQPYGLLHGGANAVLAEALGSTVAALNAGEGRVAMGLELSCTHHRAVREGIVTGVATPLHVGRGTVTVDIAITDDRGRRSCSARLTCVVRDRPPQ
jgi:1,4-dihydroxy-2-naphthoyl-CoA hydrolase